jgi:hypothetical protein
MTVEVRLIRTEPTSAQLHAWAALWRRLLRPDADAPAPETPRQEAGGADDD